MSISSQEESDCSSQFSSQDEEEEELRSLTFSDCTSEGETEDKRCFILYNAEPGAEFRLNEEIVKTIFEETGFDLNKTTGRMIPHKNVDTMQYIFDNDLLDEIGDGCIVRVASLWYSNDIPTKYIMSGVNFINSDEGEEIKLSMFGIVEELTDQDVIVDARDVFSYLRRNLRIDDLNLQEL